MRFVRSVFHTNDQLRNELKLREIVHGEITNYAPIDTPLPSISESFTAGAQDALAACQLDDTVPESGRLLPIRAPPPTRRASTRETHSPARSKLLPCNPGIRPARSEVNTPTPPARTESGLPEPSGLHHAARIPSAMRTMAHAANPASTTIRSRLFICHLLEKPEPSHCRTTTLGTIGAAIIASPRQRILSGTQCSCFGAPSISAASVAPSHTPFNGGFWSYGTSSALFCCFP